jgi:hypothetical protein
MAHPWWVNLLVAVPFFSYVFWQRASISFTRTHLLAAALFAASFGVVEGTVVVYLRAVLGAAAGYSTSLSGVAQFSENLSQVRLEPAALPPSLLRVEVFREAATIFMLVSVAAGGAECAGAVGHVYLDVRDLGCHLLRDVVGDTQVARFHDRSRCAFPDSCRVGLARLVPTSGEHSFCRSGSDRETTYCSPRLDDKRGPASRN